MATKKWQDAVAGVKSQLKKPLVLVALAVALIALVVGLVLPDNLTEDIHWGLYVSFFFFFEALTSGCMLLAAVCPCGKRSELLTLGLVSGCVTGLVILYDVGNIVNAWRLFLTPNLMAPMFLDVVFLTLILVFGFALLMLELRGTGRGTAEKVLVALLAAVAVAFPLGTSWLCVTETGRVGWNSSFEIALFILEAVTAGFIMLSVLLRGRGWTKVAGILLCSVAVALLMELGLAAYSTGNDHLSVLTMATGTYAPLFWGVVVFGLAVPGAMLLCGKRPVVAGCLGLAGIAMQKLAFIIQGNLYPDLALGDTRLAADYIPSLGEWGICLAGVAVVVAVVFVVMGMSDRAHNDMADEREA